MLVKENEVIGQKILLLLNKTVILFFFPLVNDTFFGVNTFTVICFLSPPEIATEKVKQYHTDFFVVVALDFFFIEISLTVM